MVSPNAVRQASGSGAFWLDIFSVAPGSVRLQRRYSTEGTDQQDIPEGLRRLDGSWVAPRSKRILSVTIRTRPIHWSGSRWQRRQHNASRTRVDPEERRNSNSNKKQRAYVSMRMTTDEVDVASSWTAASRGAVDCTIANACQQKRREWLLRSATKESRSVGTVAP